MATTSLVFSISPPSPPSTVLFSPPTQKLSPFFTKITSFPKPHKTRPISLSATSFTSPKTQPQEAEAVQTFWKWLTDQGVVSAKSPVRPGVVPEGLGLVAQRDIGRNEVVLEIKFFLYFIPANVQNYFIPEFAQRVVDQSGCDCRL